MKNSNSIFQITLLKTIIVIYFLYFLVNSLSSSVSFFHANAEFGIWAFISFIMLSGFILFLDIVIVLLITRLFKSKNKRAYILVLQTLICVIVYFRLNYMFKNAEKWNERVINESQTLQTDTSDKQLHDIFIKDKSQYDQTFINGLADYNEPIILNDNYILIGNDTTYFSDDLNANKATTFKGTKDNNKYVLTVTKINLTNLTYNFQLTDKDNKTVTNKSGKAILGSMFFSALENDEDSQTGEGYRSTEYWDITNDCWFAIRIGIGKDDNGKLRTLLNYGCDDKSKQTLNLNECPTLRTE